ncbi:helix-turn-helix domain-containing protein [Candidatus Stoquefichus sp. SB1]|uniref:helix-turn-helix domain-containing protein n=1 Tax=Candidatus Stoquefichus sp. SB1 TaxID=1658109 RepID=UPI0012FEDC7B|nr:helix-turn-helix domain-containing protein [Candidatus Stoquefichus sp. SB1]
MLSVNYVTRGYQVPLYPNAMQKVLLKKTFGCTRLVINHFLAIQKESLMNQGHIYTKIQISHMLTLMKKDEQFSFLGEVDSVALQSSCENLDLAFTKFFKEHKGFPHFKKKGYYSSYTAKNNNECIRTGHNCIRLPKIGWVKTKLHQSIEGHIQRVSVIDHGDGSYSLSICASCVLVETLDIQSMMNGMVWKEVHQDRSV